MYMLMRSQKKSINQKIYFDKRFEKKYNIVYNHNVKQKNIQNMKGRDSYEY